jgi:hypothetical protein
LGPPPEVFWQSVQWHAPTPIKGAVISKRMAPQAQPPVRSIVNLHYPIALASLCELC